VPYYLTQGGTSLYKLNADGTWSAITIPSTVTLAARRARFATIGKQTIMVGSPTRNLWIDETLTVRTQALRPPAYAPILDASGSGLLNGAYKVKVSYYLADAEGNIINESPLGPESEASASLSTQQLRARAIPISDESITGRILYRTTSGPGDVYYPWYVIDNNTEITVIDDLPDASLSLVAAPPLQGNPPGTMPGETCELITCWKNRLFLRGNQLVDRVYYGEDGSSYQFPVGNFFDVPPVNSDEMGMTAFATRRDELGLLKRDVSWKLVGSNPDNWNIIKFAENIGCVAQDTVVVIRDVAYWLGEDGVYSWGPEGVVCVSRERLHPYFTTSDVFNRSEFPNAFASWNPLLDTYDLFLPAAGGSVVNRWLSYSTTRKTWTGPHKTDAFTPAYASWIEDTNDLLVPIICSTAGFVYNQNQATASDDGTAIDFDVDLAHLHMDAPDDIKLFGELAMRARVEAAGTLTITPYVGDIGASAGAAISFDLTKGRLRGRILGTGRFLKLNLRNAEAAQKVRVYGLEVPFHPVGRD
jgi:hypothetical protein